MKPLVQLPFNPALTDPYGDPTRGIVPNFTRSSYGSSEDEQGNIRQAGLNSYRWKTVNGKRYLVLEPIVTNLIDGTGIKQSQDFTTWSQGTNVVTYGKTQIGPDGLYSADETVFDTSAAHDVELNSFHTELHSQNIVFSVYMRVPSGTANIDMEIASQGINTYVKTCAVTSTWTRFFFYQIMAPGDTNPLTVAITPHDTSGPTVYLWGAAVEVANGIPSTYIATTPTIVSNTNLLVDGDMDLDGTAYWNPGSGSTISKDISNAKFGKQSLRVTNAGSAVGAQQIIPTTIGGTYKISGWMYVVGGNGFLTITGPTTNGPVVSAQAWTYFELAFKATGTTSAVQLVINAAGTIYFDSISVVQQLCPEPSFEGAGTPPAGWTMNGAATYIADTVIYHSGGSSPKSAQLTTSNINDGIALTQTNLGLSASTWYIMSCWIYIQSHSAGTISPRISSDTSFNITTTFAKPTLSVWQKVSVIFKTAGSLTAGHEIAFTQGATGSMVFNLDDVSIVPLYGTTSSRIADYIVTPITNIQPSNALLYSEQFDNTAWTPLDSSVTVTPNSITAPDGNTTADQLNFTVTNKEIYQAASAQIANGLTYVFSVWMKSDFPRQIALGTLDGASGSFTTFTVGSKWRRYFITRLLNGSSTLLQCVINNIDLGSIWAWGAQCELGSFPSQYTKTTSTIMAPVFKNYASSAYSKLQGSVSLFAVVPWANTSGSFGRIFGYNDGPTGQCITDGGPANENWIAILTGLDKTGANNQKTIAIPNTAGLLNTVEHFIVMTWSTERDSTGKLLLSRVKIYIDGAKQVDTTFTDVQEWTYTSDGSFRVGNTEANSFIRDFKIWPAALNDSEVTALYVAG